MSALVAERATLDQLQHARRRLLNELKNVEGEIAAIDVKRTARARAKAVTSAVARTVVFRDGTPRDTPQHREIARRYAWSSHKGEAQPSPAPDQTGSSKLITLIRLRELERLFSVRYGPVLPDDDAGRDDLTIAAHHIAHLGPDAERHIIAWAAVWAPWMLQDEAAAVAGRVIADPVKWTADTLAWRLRLSQVERKRLAITTIGAFDMNKDQRLRERRRKNAEANRARRRAKGAVPRADYEANSLSKTRPWAALGMSRAKWYRLRKPSAALGGSCDGDPPKMGVSAVSVRPEAANKGREKNTNTAGKTSSLVHDDLSHAARCGADYGAPGRAAAGLRSRLSGEAEGKKASPPSVHDRPDASVKNAARAEKAASILPHPQKLPDGLSEQGQRMRSMTIKMMRALHAIHEAKLAGRRARRKARVLPKVKACAWETRTTSLDEAGLDAKTYMAIEV